MGARLERRVEHEDDRRQLALTGLSEHPAEAFGRGALAKLAGELYDADLGP